MKRTINALFLILTVGLFATSCSETTRNEIAVSGTWELIKTVYQDKNTVIAEVYETELKDVSPHYYQFSSNNDFLEITGAGSRYESISRGTWQVDEDVLLITRQGYSERYLIDKTSLFNMSLSQDNFMYQGKNCTRILYFKSATGKVE